MKSPRPLHRSAGFSLIELLTVMTIIAVLATLSSASLSGMMRSNSISVAANLISGELSRARTAAIAHSCNTELCIITSTSTPCIQTVLMLNNGTNVPLTRPMYLPAGIAICTNTTYSGVASMTQQTIATGLPNAGASYYAICFSATGIPRDSSGNALTTSNNYFTILSAQDAAKTLLPTPQLPANYVTLSVDDRTGAIRRYQP